MLVRNFILIFLKLSLNYLFNQVNGYIHIIACLLRPDNTAFYRDCHLNLLSVFLNAQRYMYFCVLGEVTFPACQSSIPLRC